MHPLFWVVVFAAVVAAIAVGIGFVLTYWYYFAGIAAVVFVVYVLMKRQKDAGNKV
ncbi:MAG: hypothetical protein IPI73_02600 [Betaproteobacteria bacterium]|nr:hypothetical protein [Betaproteobacteria bacterium]